MKKKEKCNSGFHNGKHIWTAAIAASKPTIDGYYWITGNQEHAENRRFQTQKGVDEDVWFEEIPQIWKCSLV